MAKSLVCKTGEYTNQQGETKGNYTRIGSLMDGNDGGQYMILDVTVSLAGCLTRQNMLNHKAGKPVRDSLMVSIFDNDNKQKAPYQAQAPGGQQHVQQNGRPDGDGEIPFMSLNPLIKAHII